MIASTKPLRADARRNRDKLVAVATEALLRDVEVPLETIAEQAGVGIGTLYRHFPNRDALVEAVYRHEVEELCEAAPALLDGRPALDALREWAEHFVRYAATKRGLAPTLRNAVGSDSPLFSETRERIRRALAVLLDAGKAEGSVRADVDSEDVMIAISAVWMVPDGAQWDAQVRRVIDLVVAGLRPPF
ncbi:TetR/AcrR family transcriptional regulator [Cellulomonas sp. APG4]|uniref:TetR/AcrR family transcriptional regulator n=1 Tax=Cellulomonas sp. APG4 TaxID=1538656 RepID=UPI00192A1BA1